MSPLSAVTRPFARLRLGETGRGVAHLTVGAAVAQVVLLVAQLALTALYTPAELNVLYVATAVGSLLAIVATGRYEMAIPLADTDGQAWRLLRLCLVLSLAVSTALFAAAVVTVVATPPTDPVWTRWGMTAGDARSAALVIPFVTWSMAAFTAYRMWTTRRADFATSSRAQIANALAQSAVQIGAGLVGAASAGLAAGYCVGRFVAVGWMASRGGPQDRSGGGTWRNLLVRWRRFPLFNTWPALLGGISAWGVVPIVAAMYGSTFGGLFGFASTMLAAPAALLGQAVSAVFFPTMARREREGGSAVAALHRAATALTFVSVPVFGAVVVLGPALASLLPHPERWQGAGEVAALLAPWLAASFVSSPLSTYATVKNRLGRILIVAILEATLRLGGLAVGLVVGDPLVGVACYAAAGVAICVYFMGWTMRLAGSGLFAWLAGVRGFLALSAAIVGGALVVARMSPPAVGVGLGIAGLLVLAFAGARGLLRLLRGA